MRIWIGNEELAELLLSMDSEEALERLKGTAPEGSGPATGSADRVAGKEPGEGPECREGGTTDRNRESHAVPPGEVSDEVIYQLLALWKSRVPEMEQRSRTAHHAGDGKRTVDALARADVYYGCAHELTMALVASRTATRAEIEAAVQRKLADMMPTDSSDLDAKRSVRRNKQITHP